MPCETCLSEQVSFIIDLKTVGHRGKLKHAIAKFVRFKMLHYICCLCLFTNIFSTSSDSASC